MANHVAPWEDEQGWTHNNYPNGYNFPEMLCSLSRYLGYPQCPEYAAKMVTENEEQVYQVYIHLSPHPDRAHILQETCPTLREAYEAVALATLTELCERHSGELESAPASYLPVHYQADGPWRVRHQRMIEFQAEMMVFQPDMEETLLEDSWPLLQSMPSISLTCSKTRDWRSSVSNSKWDSCKPQTQL